MRKLLILMIIGLVFVSACAESRLLDSKIKCDDGKIVSISEGCDSVDENNIPYEINTIKDYKFECLSSEFEVYTQVKKKYVNSCNWDACPEGAICDCFELEGKTLTIGDGFIEEEFYMEDSVSSQVWDSVEQGKWYLFTVKEGVIVSAKENKIGNMFMEHKRLCNGPAYYKGVVSELYVCESPGEGIVFKCDGSDYMVVESGGEEYKFTNVDKDVLRKLSIGGEYVFTLNYYRFTDVMLLKDYGESILYKPSKDDNVIKLKEGDNYNFEDISLTVKDIKSDGVVFFESEDKSFYISPNSETVTKDCLRIVYRGLSSINNNVYVNLHLEQANLCNDNILIVDGGLGIT